MVSEGSFDRTWGPAILPDQPKAGGSRIDTPPCSSLYSGEPKDASFAKLREMSTGRAPRIPTVIINDCCYSAVSMGQNVASSAVPEEDGRARPA